MWQWLARKVLPNGRWRYEAPFNWTDVYGTIRISGLMASAPSVHQMRAMLAEENR